MKVMRRQLKIIFILISCHSEETEACFGQCNKINGMKSTMNKPNHKVLLYNWFLSYILQ